ncbi:MAG: threonylcarbamoyl-AMP synthase [Chlorobium sp.]|nr:MAG: threonylcarbamoyl-AMP synthase [Chlorobium sp.]
MQTLLTDSAEEAAGYLNSGGIVAFPTETVYGLGAGISYPEAISRIFRAKGRPGDNPLIVHIYSLEQLAEVTSDINPDAGKLIDCFFPGPLTLVLKKNPAVPDIVTGGLDTVGVRCPSNPVAREFLRLSASPVAAPSANLSGLPSATSWEAVYHDLNGKIDCLLRGTPSAIGLESTIVDCSGTIPVLLRAGAITLEQLQSVVPELSASRNPDTLSPPKCPGLKYPHYAPKAAVVLLEEHHTQPVGCSSAYIGLSTPPEGVSLVRLCRNSEEYGRELFSFFRHCDAQGIDTIYCELPSSEGLGRAIRDRLMRAAGKK